MSTQSFEATYYDPNLSEQISNKLSETTRDVTPADLVEPMKG